MSYTIKLRRDTATNWTSLNHTLAQGEIGLETDTKKFKIGDGLTAWNSLAYVTMTVKDSGYGDYLNWNAISGHGVPMGQSILKVVIQGTPYYIPANTSGCTCTCPCTCQCTCTCTCTPCGPSSSSG
jgi:hypothetical protein